MCQYFSEFSVSKVLQPFVLCFLFAFVVSCASTSGPIPEGAGGDTLFIYRDVSPDSYHAVFVDTNRRSEYKDRLANFDFSENDRDAYRHGYEYIMKKSAEAFHSRHAIRLPTNWLPVFRYNETYYVYAPCDWGITGRISFTDSAFVRWSMDGPTPIPIAHVGSVNTLKYRVVLKDENQTDSIELTIHRIDLHTKLSVFEYASNGENWFELRIPVESIQYFPVVVNYCKDERQTEFSFEAIDFSKLLSK